MAKGGMRKPSELSPSSHQKLGLKNGQNLAGSDAPRFKQQDAYSAISSQGGVDALADAMAPLQPNDHPENYSR